MSDVDLTGLAGTLVASALAVVGLMAVTAWRAARTGRVSVVDVVWGAGFVLVAAVSAVVTALRPSDQRGSGTLRLTLLLLVAVWGVRLAAHIALRNHGKPEDPRYVALLRDSDHPARAALRQVFVPQGLAMWVVSLPVQVGMNDRAAWAPVLVAGAALWTVGLFFETVGDLQLTRFRTDPRNRGQVMDRGLWRWTRHPNYFGDACIWWGVWLVASSSWIGLAAAVGPALMTYALVAKTGKALLERGLANTRPGYADYVARTSGFVPMPRRAAPPNG